MSALVVGLGNPDRGDDAVGIAVARRVAALAPAAVDVVETDDPSTLLEVWEGHDRVVVVDAMTSGGALGTPMALDVRSSSLPSAGWGVGGTHALGLAGIVELGRALGRLPRQLVVVGVEVSATDHGAQLSAQVAPAVEDAAALVLVTLGGGENAQPSPRSRSGSAATTVQPGSAATTAQRDG